MRSLPQQNYRGRDYKACTVQDATRRPDIYKYKKLPSRCNGRSVETGVCCTSSLFSYLFLFV